MTGIAIIACDNTGVCRQVDTSNKTQTQQLTPAEVKAKKIPTCDIPLDIAKAITLTTPTNGSNSSLLRVEIDPTKVYFIGRSYPKFYGEVQYCASKDGKTTRAKASREIIEDKASTEDIMTRSLTSSEYPLGYFVEKKTVKHSSTTTPTTESPQISTKYRLCPTFEKCYAITEEGYNNAVERLPNFEDGVLKTDK